MKKSLHRKTGHLKRSIKRATEIDPSCWVRIISKLAKTFGQNCRMDFIYPIQARKLFGWYTNWAIVICCPGVDYLSFSYAGTQFPASDEFDSVCKWCARAQEPEADPGSSGTITSSSFRRVNFP